MGPTSAGCEGGEHTFFRLPHRAVYYALQTAARHLSARFSSLGVAFLAPGARSSLFFSILLFPPRFYCALLRLRIVVSQRGSECLYRVCIAVCFEWWNPAEYSRNANQTGRSTHSACARRNGSLQVATTTPLLQGLLLQSLGCQQGEDFGVVRFCDVDLLTVFLNGR